MSKEVRFKLIMLGDSAVGKTSLVRRYLGWSFNQRYLPTIGTDVYNEKKDYEYKGGKVLTNLMIWDISGHPTFREVRGNYYKGSKGAFLLYDITRPSTYEHVMDWARDFQKRVKGRFNLILVGNKVDLEDEREITTSQGEKLAEEVTDRIGKEVPFIETSAKTLKNVEKAFSTLISKILNFYLE